jgi:hypothetical protein
MCRRVKVKLFGTSTLVGRDRSSTRRCKQTGLRRKGEECKNAHTAGTDQKEERVKLKMMAENKNTAK